VFRSCQHDCQSPHEDHRRADQLNSTALLLIRGSQVRILSGVPIRLGVHLDIAVPHQAGGSRAALGRDGERDVGRGLVLIR
jgi:hypothetical protein